MSKILNKVMLIGHIGSDPVETATPSGTKVVKLNLYQTEKQKNRATKEVHEVTYRHRLVFFGRIAENTMLYVKKGSHLHVEGKLVTRSWTDKQGNVRYMTEVYVKDMILLDSKDGKAKFELKASEASDGSEAEESLLEEEVDVVEE